MVGIISFEEIFKCVVCIFSVLMLKMKHFKWFLIVLSLFTVKDSTLMEVNNADSTLLERAKKGLELP